MKLKLFDKVMFVIMLIAGFVSAIALAIACIFPSYLEKIAWAIVYVANNLLLRILLFLALGVIIFLLIRIFFVRQPRAKLGAGGSKAGAKPVEYENGKGRISKNQKHASSPAASDIKISSDDGGSSFVSSDLIVKIIQTEAQSVHGVVSCDASISQSDLASGGVNVKLDIAAGEDQLLPQLSSQIQEKIRSSVEEKTGINIESVEVSFSSLSSQSADTGYTTLN